MKGDSIWIGVAAAAALLGAGAYVALNDWTTTAFVPPAGIAPGVPTSGSGTNRSAATQDNDETGTFTFASPSADANDIADVSFVDGDGRRMSFADFQGRNVLVNVWATWCGPCREEMPTLDRLQTRLGGADFEVVALSIDLAGIEVVREFYEELGLKSLRIYVDPSGRSAAGLKVLALPSTLVLDRTGRELGRFLGPAQWDSEPVVEAIQKLLGKAGPRRGATAKSGNGRTAQPRD